MDIKTDIQKQVSAGFSKEEIFQNLRGNGYSNEEITKEYTLVASDKDFIHPESSSGGGSVSAGSILVGILFVGIAIFRFARASSGNGIFS